MIVGGALLLDRVARRLELLVAQERSTQWPSYCQACRLFRRLRLHLSVLAQDANRPNLLRQALDLVLDELQRLVRRLLESLLAVPGSFPRRSSEGRRK